MGISLSEEKVSIVLIGSFEPNVARAENLAAVEVIRSTDLEALKYRGLLDGQVADYSLGWCTVAVTRDRFTVEATQPPFIKVCDLVLKTVSELMPSATVNVFGINRYYKMTFSDMETRASFGLRLVPPSEWGEWGKAISEQIQDGKVFSHGGVSQVTMRQQPVPNREGGWRDVQILAQSMPTDPKAVPGAGLIINDHFQLDPTKHPEAADAVETARRRTSALLAILADQFQPSIDESELIAKGLVKRKNMSQDLTSYPDWISYGNSERAFAANNWPAIEIDHVAPNSSILVSRLSTQNFLHPPSEIWESQTRGQRATTISRTSFEASKVEFTEEVLAEWDGYVETVKSKYFVARMRGLKGDGVAGKEEEAEIPISDVDPDDRLLLVPGGFFRLLIGYETRRGGIRRRFTSVAFRRLPTYTQREIDDAEREAQEIASGFVLAGPGDPAVG